MKNGPYELIIAPADWEGVLYRSRYCYEHHYEYWKGTGYLLKKGDSIHHKDGNKRNNVLSNLELLSDSTHKSLHANKGRLWAEMICPNCENHFEREYRNTLLKDGLPKTIFCSKRCVGLYPKDKYKTTVTQVVKKFRKFLAHNVQGETCLTVNQE